MSGQNFTNDLERDGRGRPVFIDPVTGEKRTYQRISGIAKALDDQTGLHRWEMRNLAQELSRSSRYALAINGAEDDKAAGRIVSGALEACRLKLAADIGSYLHYRLELVDRGGDRG